MLVGISRIPLRRTAVWHLLAAGETKIVFAKDFIKRAVRRWPLSHMYLLLGQSVSRCLGWAPFGLPCYLIYYTGASWTYSSKVGHCGLHSMVKKYERHVYNWVRKGTHVALNHWNLTGLSISKRVHTVADSVQPKDRAKNVNKTRNNNTIISE